MSGITGKLKWAWTRLYRSLWYRASMYSLLGLAIAILSPVFGAWLTLPDFLILESGAVETILNVITSSMLAVTTFSLGSMVTAYGSVTSNISPRANLLLTEDRVTQNTLSTFIGAFLFSLVGIIGLATDVYNPAGRTILFAATLIVVLLVIYQLIKWAGYLTQLGRVRNTIDKIEQAASQALQKRIDSPYLGGKAMPESLPEGLTAVTAECIGYLQHVNAEALNAIAKQHDQEMYINVLPGNFTSLATPLVYTAITDPEIHDSIRNTFTIASERYFDNDPRFGVIVMSEVASKALSPGINDSGTAIDAIGCGTRLLSPWIKHAAGGIDEAAPPLSHIYAHAISTQDLIEDFFRPIARDGAGTLEIGVRLLKAMQVLEDIGDDKVKQIFANQRKELLERFDQGLAIDADKAHLLQTAKGEKHDLLSQKKPE